MKIFWFSHFNFWNFILDFFFNDHSILWIIQYIDTITAAEDSVISGHLENFGKLFDIENFLIFWLQLLKFHFYFPPKAREVYNRNCQSVCQSVSQSVSQSVCVSVRPKKRWFCLSLWTRYFYMKTTECQIFGVLVSERDIFRFLTLRKISNIFWLSTFNFWNFIFDFLLQWSFNTMVHSFNTLILLLLLTRWCLWTLRKFLNFF